MAVAGTYRYVGVLPSEPFFGSGFGLPLAVVDHADVTSAQVHQTQTTSSPASLTSPQPAQLQQPASQSSVRASKRLSRPMDLLRWFSTIKGRCKEKDLTSCITGDVADNGRSYLDDELTRESIVDVDLSATVFRPIGVEYNEWLATHTIHFFEHANIIYGCVAEFCWHSEACCTITAPSSLYQWVDERGRRTKCSAAQYIDHGLSMTQSLVNDEAVFPTKYGNKFPGSFESTVRKIMRLLLDVLTHVYRVHWQHLVELQLHPHFNTLLYHVMLFAKHFQLVDTRKDEATTVLDELFERLQRHSRAMAAARRSTCTPPAHDDDVIGAGAATDTPPPVSTESLQSADAAVQNSTEPSS